MNMIQATGMAWFAEDDYESFRAVLPDRAWHATYRQWLAAAEQGVKQHEKLGRRIVKAHVRSDTFVQWCRDTGRDIKTQALLDFANEAAFRALTQAKAD